MKLPDTHTQTHKHTDTHNVLPKATTKNAIQQNKLKNISISQNEILTNFQVIQKKAGKGIQK